MQARVRTLLSNSPMDRVGSEYFDVFKDKVERERYE